MNDLKAFGENRIKEIQAEINKIKTKNKKVFDEIAELEAEKAPISKLIRDFDRQLKNVVKPVK